MDTLGIEPRAFRMRSGCDTTTPCAQYTKIWPCQPAGFGSHKGANFKHCRVNMAKVQTAQVNLLCWTAPHTKKSDRAPTGRMKNISTRFDLGQLKFLQKVDTLGIEPRAFRMQSGCDTTTPCAQCIASGLGPVGVRSLVYRGLHWSTSQR